MSVQHFILATAGHVDHGKSAIVKALTGTDPDRLPEEKARGITIDLGFAHLELKAPDDASRVFHVGIVDVPGHEDFVKNMVAGVGSIDLALFIVAADDGWMPQTEEHLQILTYLGIRRAVVALTKIDLIPGEDERLAVIAHIHEKLRESPFAEAPIAPTSVITGTGLSDLKTALARVLMETPPPRDIGKPRLPVDRVFILRGIGTVVTGTLSGGNLRRGQAVVVQPASHATKIRSVQSHNRDVETIVPGTRTALNLPDLGGHAEQGGTGIQRGHVVTLPEFGGASDTLGVALEKSARLQETKSGAARPLKDGTIVRVHHGSGSFSARVALLDHEPVMPGQRVLAQLRCESPVFAFAGDHFIVRDWSEQWTLAGGVILDPDATRRHFRSPAQRSLLEQRAQAPESACSFVRSQLTRDGATRRSRLLIKSRFSTAEIVESLSGLITKGTAVSMGDWIMEAAWWQTLRKRAGEAIDAEHRQRPQLVGLPLSELRRVIEPSLPVPELFDALVGDLTQNGFAQAATAIRRASHRPALPPNLQAAGTKLRAGLSAKPFEPPSRKELAPDAMAQQALRFLLETGEAVEIGEEVVLLTDAYGRATEIIRQFLRSRGSGTVSEIRQAIGASRRIVVPLLERLDREGMTRREGDKRVLR
ncbi:MAG: selenocysteine-specific translation elongation factor [Verrucomicrobia bacterium]|nr:selenocysteine-specific translation elongation factor [Verrucomicrobiota bacterium]